jgi:hypothetical protein
MVTLGDASPGKMTTDIDPVNKATGHRLYQAYRWKPVNIA